MHNTIHICMYSSHLDKSVYNIQGGEQSGTILPDLGAYTHVPRSSRQPHALSSCLLSSLSFHILFMIPLHRYWVSFCATASSIIHSLSNPIGSDRIGFYSWYSFRYPRLAAMSDGVCGPSNALQDLRKNASVDRTLQQDHLVARQPQGQVISYSDIRKSYSD